MFARFKYVALALAIFAAPAFAIDLSNEKPSENIEIGLKPYYMAGAVCEGSVNEVQFRENVAPLNPTIMTAKPATLDIVMAHINSIRQNSNMPAYEASKMIIGIFSIQGELKVGVAIIDKQGCVIPDTVYSMSGYEFVEFITKMGLSIDDFVEDKGII